MTDPNSDPSMEHVAKRNQVITPLVLISLFLTFTEVIAGVVLAKVEGNVQVSLTVFVVAFPTLVALAFFAILWNRPWVLYPPADFGDSAGVSSFVEAMRRTSIDEGRLRSLIESAISAALSTPEAQSVLLAGSDTAGGNGDKRLDEATKALTSIALKEAERSFVTVDIRAVGGKDGPLIIATDEELVVSEFLNQIWYNIFEQVPAWTYGSHWLLRDSRSGSEFRKLGSAWAKGMRAPADSRLLSDVGITGGMDLEVIAGPRFRRRANSKTTV